LPENLFKRMFANSNLNLKLNPKDSFTLERSRVERNEDQNNARILKGNLS